MTQLREEVEDRVHSQSRRVDEADLVSSSRVQISSLKEAQFKEPKSFTFESRASKTKLERVRDRGTLRERKAPILFERRTPSEGE